MQKTISFLTALTVITLLSCNGITQPRNNVEVRDNAQLSVPKHSSVDDIEIVKHNAKWAMSGTMEIFVVCRNNSDEDKKYVQINASFFDKDENPVGSGIGNTSNFPAHSEKTITVLGSGLDNTVKSYKVNIENVMP